MTASPRTDGADHSATRSADLGPHGRARGHPRRSSPGRSPTCRPRRPWTAAGRSPSTWRPGSVCAMASNSCSPTAHSVSSGSPHPYLDATSALALDLLDRDLRRAHRHDAGRSRDGSLPLWAAFVVTLLVARIFVAAAAVRGVPGPDLRVVRRSARRPDQAADARARRRSVAFSPERRSSARSMSASSSSRWWAVTIVTIGRPWGRSVGVYVVATVASGLAFWLATGQHLADLGAYASGVYEVISGYNAAMGADPAETRTMALSRVAGRGRDPDLDRLAQQPRVAATTTDRSRDAGGRLRLRDVEACGRPGARDLRLCDRPRGDVPVRNPRRPSNMAGSRLARDRDRLCRVFRDATHDVSRRRRVDALDRQRGRGIPSCPVGRNGRRSGPRTASGAGTTSTRRRSRRSGPRPSISTRSWPRPRMPIRISPGAAARPSSRTPPIRRPSIGSMPTFFGRPRCRSGSCATSSPLTHSDRVRLLDRSTVRRRRIHPDHRRWHGSAGSNRRTRCSRRSAAMTRSPRPNAGRCSPGPIGRADRRSPSARSRLGPGSTVTIPSRPGRIGSSRSRSTVSSRPSSAAFGTLLYKAPDWYVKLDDTRYRLMPGTAGDGLLVAVPPSADGTGHFAFGPPIKTMTVTQGEGGHGSKGPLTFTFESVPRSAE